MKKILNFAFAIAGCAFLMACGKKSEQSSTNTDSLKVEASATDDAEDKNAYLSPDLALNDLKGKVSKVTLKQTGCNPEGKVMTDDSYWATTVKVFDVDNFLLPDAKETDWRLPNPRIKRNDKDQIVSVNWLVEDFDCDVSEEYTYNEDGTLKSMKMIGIESCDETTYTYNADGSLQKSVSLGAGEGTIYRTTTIYRILETDAQGNWTRRLQSQTCEDGPDNGSGEYIGSMEDYILEVREISYYK